MRGIQKLLLVIGATALGASLAGLSVFAFMVGQPSPPGIAGVGAAGLAMICYAAGTALGALVGFAAAIVWIVTRKGEAWKPRVWCGMTLGILTGLVLYVLGGIADSPPKVGLSESWPLVWARDVINGLPNGSELAEMIACWPVAAVLTPALGMLGGAAAKLAGLPWDRHDGDRPRKGNEPTPKPVAEEVE